MNLFLYGTGNYPSTFIKRRITSLVQAGIKCYFIHNGKITNFFNQESLKVRFKKNKYYLILYMICNILIVPKSFLIFLYLIKQNLFNFNLKKLVKVIEFSYYFTKPIHLIHFQWISHLADTPILKPLLKIPIVASVRGSMVTVYPYKIPNYVTLLNQSFSIADKIHFVSKGLMNYCINKFSINPEKCFVNYNGIDVNKFKPLDNLFNKKNYGKIKLISVGALIWRKNFQDLIKIVKQSKNLSIIELFIIGEGEERFILEFLISRYNLNEHVKLVGYLSENQIISELQNADIYLSTSYTEGLSNAVMEASACALPTIAFDCEGMNEIIIDNISGFIVEHGRTDIFVSKLDELIETYHLREYMGMNARKHILDNFIEENHVNEMYKIYQHLIDS